MVKYSIDDKKQGRKWKTFLFAMEWVKTQEYVNRVDKFISFAILNRAMRLWKWMFMQRKNSPIYSPEGVISKLGTVNTRAIINGIYIG